MALATTGKPVIGFLNSASAEGMTAQLRAFHKGLKLGGYVDGENVRIEYRWAESDYGRLADFAADLAGRDLVLIAATGGVQTAQVVRKATSKIPVLFLAGGPIGQKTVVPTLKGRNATGVNLEQTPMVVQRMELLNQLDPRPAQISLLVYPNKGGKIEAEILRKAARQGKQRVQIIEAKNVNELRAVVRTSKSANEGLLIQADPFLFTQRALIAELANRSGMPAMYPWQEYVQAGGLMSYGPSLEKAYRQIGQYAAMVLDGANPGSLPILRASSFELAINLSTAKALKLVIPPTLLARADHIIE
jgi:putative tryptophan/tyrosine transport system substrate-binding protein